MYPYSLPEGALIPALVAAPPFPLDVDDPNPATVVTVVPVTARMRLLLLSCRGDGSADAVVIAAGTISLLAGIYQSSGFADGAALGAAKFGFSPSSYNDLGISPRGVIYIAVDT